MFLLSSPFYANLSSPTQLSHNWSPSSLPPLSNRWMLSYTVFYIYRLSHQISKKWKLVIHTVGGRPGRPRTPMMAFSSVMVTCLARSTACATCCWCFENNEKKVYSKALKFSNDNKKTNATCNAYYSIIWIYMKSFSSTHFTHVEKGKKNRTVLPLFLTNTSHHYASDGKIRLRIVESQKGHLKW